MLLIIQEPRVLIVIDNLHPSVTLEPPLAVPDSLQLNLDYAEIFSLTLHVLCAILYHIESLLQLLYHLNHLNAPLLHIKIIRSGLLTDALPDRVDD